MKSTRIHIQYIYRVIQKKLSFFLCNFLDFYNTNIGKWYTIRKINKIAILHSNAVHPKLLFPEKKAIFMSNFAPNQTQILIVLLFFLERFFNRIILLVLLFLPLRDELLMFSISSTYWCLTFVSLYAKRFTS